jgi:hypothetical protein
MMKNIELGIAYQSCGIGKKYDSQLNLYVPYISFRRHVERKNRKVSKNSKFRGNH